jgi:hypothetical protein
MHKWDFPERRQNRWGVQEKLFLISIIKYQNKSLFPFCHRRSRGALACRWAKLFPIIGCTPISIRSCRSRKPHPTFGNGIAAEKRSPKPCSAQWGEPRHVMFVKKVDREIILANEEDSEIGPLFLGVSVLSQSSVQWIDLRCVTDLPLRRTCSYKPTRHPNPIIMWL